MPPRRPPPGASLLLLLALLLGSAFSSSAFQISPFSGVGSTRGRGHHSLGAPSIWQPSTGRCQGTSVATDIIRRSSKTALDMGASGSALSETTKEAFRGKTILITGASRGLGRSLACALSQCNPSLLILSGRDEKALLGVQEECIEIAKQSGASVDAEIATCDLADKSSVDQLASTALQLAQECKSNNPRASGVIDVLINNGGISSRSSFLESRLDVDERLMQVNFFAGAALAKAAVPGMIERGGGRVVWISSVQGKLGTPYRTSYAASKFAVQGYTEALRSELASSGVSVHVASPGYIRTDLSRSAVMGDGRAYSKTDETTANGADPDEVAAEILDSVAYGTTDFVVAATFSAKVGMWLKFLAPRFLEGQLAKRYEKQRIGSEKSD
ncbi:hypothetical protein ACHAXT_008360 [Thalassiosira profunda]